MRRVHCFSKYVSCFVTITMLLMSMPLQTLQASMIGTETVLILSKAQNMRENLHKFLERKDVQGMMTAQGVSPIEAKARVDCLSDAEVMEIADKMDQLPSGGDGIGAIVGAVLIIFLVLLFTDIMGYTDVFPFVKHSSRK
ncbi:MAG TPA: PA2779 family protein [Desulfobacterales bacterium]|nr:PA2779 family protein [Desulfobacterales bacterium]